MAEIHPSSVVHPDAILADDVIIGPLCYVGPHVKLGAGCILHDHVSIGGPSTFGERNQFFAGAAIGHQAQDLKYSGEPTYLEVGNDNTFREQTVIHRGSLPGNKTIIGNNNHFLNSSHLAHDCIVHDHVILSGFAGVAGHVEIFDHAILGGFAAVHQFVRIGEHSMVGGATKIVMDIPPYMLCDGHPAAIRGINIVGLRRRGVAEEDIRAIKFTYKKLFLHKQSSLSDAIAEARENAEFKDNPYVKRIVDFIQSSGQRGICR